jgi:hypothetical protein
MIHFSKYLDSRSNVQEETEVQYQIDTEQQCTLQKANQGKYNAKY